MSAVAIMWDWTEPSAVAFSGRALSPAPRFSVRRSSLYGDAQTSARLESAGEPLWRSIAIQKVVELMMLPAGWDGARSVPVSAEVAAYAIDLLSQTMPTDDGVLPHFVPLNDGRLGMEWHRRGLDVELLVGDAEVEASWEELATGKWGELELDVDLTPLVPIIRRVASRS